MNSDLYGDVIGTIPDNVLLLIKTSLNKFPNSKGIERAKNLLANKNISYSNAKKIKSFLDNFSIQNDEISSFELCGGKLMQDWLNQTLRLKRDSIHRTKETKSTVFDNQFKKNHNKDGFDRMSNKISNQMNNMNNQIKRIEESESFIYMFEEFERDLTKVPQKSSVGVILNDNDEILLVKRSNKTEWMPNKWALVGGKTEIGETKEQSLVREIKEETELTLSKYKFVFDKREPNFIVSMFLCRASNPNDVKICDEATEYKWSRIEDFDKLDTVPNLKTDALICLINYSV